MLVEVRKVLITQEVNEPVSHIALILDIAGQIQEIISIAEIVINFLWQFLDCIFVGNVPDHHCSSRIICYLLCSNQENTALFVCFVVIWVGIRLVAPVLLSVVEHVGANVHRTGWTLLNRLVYRENTPKLASLVLGILVNDWVLTFAPHTVDSFALDLWQNCVERTLYDFFALCLFDGYWWLFCFIFVLNFSFVLGNWSPILFKTVRHLSATFFVTSFRPDEAGDVISANIELDFDGDLLGLGMDQVWRGSFVPFTLLLTFHLEFFKNNVIIP